MERYFQVKLRDIPEGEKQAEIEFGRMSVAALLKDSADICGISKPLSLKCSYTRRGAEIVLEASYRVQLKLNCINCLGEFSYGLDSSFRYVFRPGPEEAGPEEQELQGDDLEVSYYEGENIDLSTILREQIYINLPHYPHCKEGCLGLCVNCGVNLNRGSCKCLSDDKKESSPFSVLKKLKEDK